MLRRPLPCGVPAPYRLMLERGRSALSQKMREPIQATLRHASSGTSALWRASRSFEASFLTYRLQPYHRNLGRRIVKTPKLTFWRDATRRAVAYAGDEALGASHGLVVGSGSRKNGLTARGCEFRRLGEPQTSLLIAFVAESDLPLPSRMCEGSGARRVRGAGGRGRRVLAYRDLLESAMEQANYLRHMGRGDRAHTRERLDELAPLPGVTVLQASLPAAERDAEAVYGLYKRRWSVEAYPDYFKNGQDARGLCQQDLHRVQGLASANTRPAVKGPIPFVKMHLLRKCEHLSEKCAVRKDHRHHTPPGRVRL